MLRDYAFKLIRRLNKKVEKRGAPPCPDGSAVCASKDARLARMIPMSVTRDRRTAHGTSRLGTRPTRESMPTR